MTSVWNFLNMLLLVTAIAVTSEKGDIREYIRIPLNRACSMIIDGVRYEAMVSDISEGGLSISPAIKEGKEELLKASENIVIELTDVDGVPFDAPCTFLKSFQWGGTLVFNFKDLEHDLELRQNLILLIYGNTTAWNEFEDKHYIMNPIQSIVYILKQSFKNAMFREAYKLTFNYFLDLTPLGKGKQK